MKIFFILIFPLFLYAQFMDVSQLPDVKNKPKVQNMTIAEAKLAIGYDKALIQDSNKLINAQTPIVIIDAGFYGIKEFLKKNPQYKKNIKRWYMFNDTGVQSKETHGFDVYKTALADTPKAIFHLYEIDLRNSVKNLEKVFKQMKKDQLYLANASLGSATFVGEDKRAHNKKFLKMLEKYQITLFQSIGNEKGKAHYFKYNDIDNNKYLEFIDSNKSDKPAEYNAIKVFKGKEVKISLKWQHSDNKDISNNIELQLVNKKGKVVLSTKKDRNDELFLKYKPKDTKYLWIRVVDRGINKPKNKHFSLYVKNAYCGSKYAYFNGFGISTYRSLVESPFIVSVGSFGKNDKGELLPSRFSSYSKTVDGEILPHVLGPGQLLVDGRKINGTSFSSPFITAFASRAADYNIKNFIESVSTKKNFSPKVKEIEKSRWGIPSLKNWGMYNYCLTSNKAKNFQLQEVDNKIIISFDFSRSCMEKINYRLLLRLKGYKNDKLEHKKHFDFFSPVYKSKTKNIVDKKVTFSIPIDKLPVKYEKFLLDELKIQTMALKNSTRNVLYLHSRKMSIKNPNNLQKSVKPKPKQNYTKDRLEVAKSTAIKICNAFKNKDKNSVLDMTHHTIKEMINEGFNEKIENDSKKMLCDVDKVEEDLETGGIYVHFEKDKMLIVEENEKYLWTFEDQYKEYLYKQMPPYPDDPEQVSIAVCKSLKNKNWPELLGYIDYDYLPKVKEMILKIKGTNEFTNLDCKTVDFKSKDKGVKSFKFNKLGNIDLKKIDDYWYVIKF